MEIREKLKTLRRSLRIGLLNLEMNSLGWTTTLVTCEPRPTRWCILESDGDFLPIKTSLSGVLNSSPRRSFKPQGKTVLSCSIQHVSLAFLLDVREGSNAFRAVKQYPTFFRKSDLRKMSFYNFLYWIALIKYGKTRMRKPCLMAIE